MTVKSTKRYVFKLQRFFCVISNAALSDTAVPNFVSIDAVFTAAKVCGSIPAVMRKKYFFESCPFHRQFYQQIKSSSKLSTTK